MKIQMIKCVRFKIIKPIDCDWKDFGKILRELQRDTREVMNKSIQYCWEYQGYASDYKKDNGQYPKTKDVIKYSDLRGYCYDKLKHDYYKFNTSNYSMSIKRSVDKWKSDLKNILKGDVSIPSYKKDMPLDLHNKSIKLIKEDNEYYFNLSLISNKYKSETNRSSGQYLLLVKVNSGSQKAILNRILSGEYKISASQILHNKNKWFINLSYSFEKEIKTLDKNNIMGVDMGIVNAAYMAFNNSLDRYRIGKSEIEKFRKRVEKIKNQLLEQGKYCGSGRIGHGVKTRIKPIEAIGNKISNFRKTVNHKYSKYIVQMALKHNCGVIQMENLTGISKDDKFLKNWSYYDLQQKVEYKAKENGIQVKYVNPKYTSQRCHKCGHIDKNNRPTQEKFICNSCGYFGNADYNAAKNIATQDIELIIENYGLQSDCVTPKEMCIMLDAGADISNLKVVV